jgi:hypothetical protein
MLKKFLTAIVFPCLGLYGLFAQQLKQTKPVEAVVFTKTIEQNFIQTDDKTKKEYNLAGKQYLEKLFFGDLNAQVEYLMIPPFAGAYGLRIVKTGQNASYKIEIKYIANYKEAESQIDEKFPLGSMSIEKALGMSEEEKHRMAEATRIKLIEREKASLKLYKVKTLTVPVSAAFAETLHARITSAIQVLDMEKKVPGMIFDPDKIIFRCIVGDELWTLAYRNPQGEIGELSDLCKRIVEDAEAGRFDESKYIGRLEDYGQEDCN